jgi:hypothetical protein
MTDPRAHPNDDDKLCICGATRRHPVHATGCPDRARALPHTRAILLAAINVAIARQEQGRVHEELHALHGEEPLRDLLAEAPADGTLRVDFIRLVAATAHLHEMVDALTTTVVDAQITHDAPSN